MLSAVFNPIVPVLAERVGSVDLGTESHAHGWCYVWLAVERSWSSLS